MAQRRDRGAVHRPQGPVAIAFALLLNQKIRGRSIIRVLIFVPYVISEVIVGTGWSLMLQTNGAINGFLESIGLGALTQDWLANPELAIWTLMVILTWKYIGFAVILFLAGMQNIPKELSEAAAVDGASYGQTQRLITPPLLGPTIRIWAFLSIIGALQLFDLVYIIWGQYVSSTAGTTFWRQVGNSTSAALATTIGVFVQGVMASYVLARYQFRGRARCTPCSRPV